MKNEILSCLKLAKIYINDILNELDERKEFTITKDDMEIVKKVYQYSMEAKNKIVYGDNLPF